MDFKITVENIPQFLRTKRGRILSIWRRSFTVAGVLKINNITVNDKDSHGYAKTIKEFANTPTGEKELVDYLNIEILQNGSEPIWIPKNS